MDRLDVPDYSAVVAMCRGNLGLGRQAGGTLGKGGVAAPDVAVTSVASLKFAGRID